MGQTGSDGQTPALPAAPVQANTSLKTQVSMFSGKDWDVLSPINTELEEEGRGEEENQKYQAITEKQHTVNPHVNNQL